ncbi:catalase-domain-containing protein [Rhodotorula sp. JG-1b]|nr:catalase-domain-containing protein [Rhodotorula sp. JG-1b]
MSYTGDGVAQTQAFAHARKQLASNDKIAQLEGFTTRVPTDGDKHVSVFSQAPVDNLDTSMRAGARGPTSIDDPVARERISHFDHERIPERVVHARGVGAHGYFKLHTSLAEYTTADVLTKVGQETPTFVRFSTVLGSNGAAETAREVRGFATKFYTNFGNWDIVGNNIPVFFIQDGIKFVDLIHAGKPAPQIHLPQAQTAHDNFWDFIGRTPESVFMSLFSLSDYTIPRSYRMIKGFGVNTFVLVNAEGKRTFVKFHWKPHLGSHGLVWDEALKLGGQDPDYLRRDLADAIEAGAYPSYEFGVQLISEEQEQTFDFDILDCTKWVPEELVPIKWVGTMTLNRNPTNYFAETEQVAFCTSNVVPGIDYSNDPMLQLRNFSYFDTQISRLGGVNFNALPINRSVCPFISTIRDGQHQPRIMAGPHYYPNRFETPNAATPHGKGQNYAHDEAAVAKATEVKEGHLTFAPYKVEGVRGRLRPARFDNHYSQAQLFWNSLDPIEQQHIIDAAIFELGRCDDREVQRMNILRWNNVDHQLAVAVAAAFDIDVPTPEIPNHGKKTDGENSFSLMSPNNPSSAVGRRIAIFALDGFDSLQVSGMVAAIGALGSIPNIIGTRKGPCYPRGTTKGDSGAKGVIDSNFTLETARSTLFDGLFIPDGDENFVKELSQGRGLHWIREAFAHYKTIGAVGASIPVLAHKALPGITDYKADLAAAYSSKNGMVLAENLAGDEASAWEKIKGAKDLTGFGAEFINALSKHRHWHRKQTEEVAF